MKTNKLKKWTIGALSTGLLASSVFFAPKASAAVEPITVDAKAAFVIDNETNKILLEQNGDESLGIASMTKMLSVYVILEAIEAGEISWDTTVPISDYALNISQDYELSNVPLRLDFTYTVRDLYEAMLIYSANGASIAMAELVAGSESAFVDMMKAKLDEWGVTDYSIYNSTGLPNYYAEQYGQLYPEAPADTENHMTARGVATLADHLLDDYPEVLETTSIVEKTFMEGSDDEINMLTYNHMLPEMIHYRPNVDGLKTGTTDDSGASFTGTAVENEMRIITVVIGAADNTTRFSETSRLMDYAFDNFDKVQIVETGTPVETEEPIEVAKGKEEEVGLVYNSDLTVVTPKTEDRKIETELTLNQDLLNEDGVVEAPIEEGTVVGKVAISIEGDDLGYLGNKQYEANVAVERTIEKANIFALAWRWVASTTARGWNSVTDFVTGFF
ncbi:serine hydrolase [Jeotgalibaca ciconiae]|uniref:serine-type D-Ala-D-Ala carboxypeptidase n=2 Tax=Jeotgalibaca TaxID=1470540 RepID=A0A3Q9BKB1_9LACT|nr:serine hydrolase [Jeotgalibaca ciconiae]AZP04359.1 D-alanyl-D-alanine carboxypeptidase [Jeotgalibaca ciconiae]HJA89770.1 D-alanyl-D-alanine carboxypeptidase [Candidatus Jeotgalibaca merdavium]HJB23159.1 D-alanyl-D-alanine carboxypeptidase [Candidatus Jeotgalibaca pullicola]